MRYLITVLLVGISFLSCKTDGPNKEQGPYKTKNVLIIVMDGARYSECLGDRSRKYIPKLDSITRIHGVISVNFRNEGVTNTNSGHTAICTGVYENVENSTAGHPTYPNMFQCFREAKKLPQEKTWVVASKDKLEVLKNCQISSYKNINLPMTDCGKNGLGTGYRTDDTTYAHCIKILSLHHPNLLLVNFKEPDYSGHANNWIGYLKGIKDVDQYIANIWKFVQSDSVYKDNTTLIVTNDHGRHLDGHLDGFVSHGDDCEGCRHINFYAIGPDFKKGAVISTPNGLIDIPATVAELLGFKMYYSQGRYMNELFQR